MHTQMAAEDTTAGTNIADDQSIAPERNFKEQAGRAARNSPMMTINLLIVQPLIALVAGTLILIIPRLLNYIVAIYLIIIGLSGLLPHLVR
jgi:Protein of unknown function (DUF3096)